MKRIAGLLAGCGYLDGTEIHEAVLALLALERRGVTVDWFAPDLPQVHVINHLDGQSLPGEERRVLLESARIVRGRVRPLDELDPARMDALVVPGGYGAAKHLCSFAFDGGAMSVLPEVQRLVLTAHAAGLPMAFICIAPVIAAKVLGGVGARPRVTIGTDAATAALIRSWGGVHQDCRADEICEDAANRLLSTPAWNSAGSIVQVADGIEALVGRLVVMD